MRIVKELCPNCKSPNPQKKLVCEWCGANTEEEVLPVQSEPKISINIQSTNYNEKSDFIFKKNGEFKSGLLSKVNASTFHFYSDRIIVRPMGYNRLFNSADIIIPKFDILSVEPSFRLIGYNFILRTNRGAKFWLSFMGDKQKIGEILYSYIIKR